MRQWATYFGASGDESFDGIALDAAGNILATGFTNSATGLATTGAFKTTCGGSYDAFLAKFSPNGALKWSTYYGGSSLDFAYGVATDKSGNIYMGGQSKSLTGIASPGAYHTSIGDGLGATEDAFIAKFDSNGTRQWATYYGGANYDFGNSVATDTAGNVYLAGLTNSTSGIATSGAFSGSFSGGLYDAFIVKFSSSGTPIWGTYYGGSNDDQANDLATDALGNIYMSGYTESFSGIGTADAYQPGLVGAYDAFLVKFSGTGDRLWATYYGGFASDYGNSVALDDTGNVFLAGYTSSTIGIATPGAWQDSFGGGSWDAFVVKFDSLGARKWATYYGGDSLDQAYSVTVDKSGYVYLAGNSQSDSSIATAGAYQTVFGGGANFGDAFLAKFKPINYLGVSTLQTNDKQLILFYPNPAIGSFTVKSSGQGMLSMISATGTKVNEVRLEKGNTRVNISSDVAPGQYTCYFIGADGRTDAVNLTILAK